MHDACAVREAARLWGMVMTNEQLRALLLESKRKHYVCEDCWYSCPESGECCDEREKECNCGAAEWNAKVDAAIASSVEPPVPNIESKDSGAAEPTQSPADLVGALQDVVHTDVGQVRAGRAVKAEQAPNCPATWQPFAHGKIIPCTLLAGHAGKHKAPEPFSEETSLEGVTNNQINFAQAVTGTAMDAGLSRDQFLRLASIAWEVHSRAAENRGTDHG